MNAWMSKAEALKTAQVSVFDAKRYLSAFSRFIPSDKLIVRGDRVSPLVPELLTHFKLLEASGLSLEQIEQSICSHLEAGQEPHWLTGDRPEASWQPDVMMDLVKKMALTQVRTQCELLNLVQFCHSQINILKARIDRLEQLE
ncbi:MAG: hypothetical protein E6X17_09250 [Sporomusaceae bacterium]|nr:hypothetical protein [Sporomusaceae bacterium]